jgi:hypothetical protein
MPPWPPTCRRGGAGLTFRSDVTVELVRAAAQTPTCCSPPRVDQGEQSLDQLDADAQRSKA